MMRLERATITEERETADVRVRRFSPLDAETRAGLEELRAGATCEECRWQPATRVTRHRLLCATCSQVEHDMRTVEAVAVRLHRRR